VAKAAAAGSEAFNAERTESFMKRAGSFVQDIADIFFSDFGKVITTAFTATPQWPRAAEPGGGGGPPPGGGGGPPPGGGGGPPPGGGGGGGPGGPPPVKMRPQDHKQIHAQLLR
jgi:hypothetical protein